MKYIRTKDGKIKELNFDYRTGAFTGNGYYRYKATSTEQDGLVHKNYVIKQADTIEELCDEFVIIRRDDNTFALAKYYPDDKTFYVKTADEEVSLNECLMYEYEIYGAIWTDKGLIYKAKMNEKGELELL